MFNTHGFGIESTRRRFLPGCCKKHDRRGMGGVLADQTPADFDETLATSADHSPAFSLTSVAPRKTVRQLALTPALTGFWLDFKLQMKCFHVGHAELQGLLIDIGIDS